MAGTGQSGWTREESEALQRALLAPRFELIPIKGMEEEASHLPAGATVTVTSSPAKGIERTLQAAEWLAERGFHVVPHIAARLVGGDAHLKSITRRLAVLNVREIFVIGGDAREPAGPFRSALDLLLGLSRIEHRVGRIGVAGYPERHPLVDEVALAGALEAKAAYADYIVTQICFDPAVIISWVSSIRRNGIALPVFAGLPGVVDRKQLLSISLKIGVGDSTRFLARHAGMVGMLLKPGGYDPTDLVRGLAPALVSADAGIAGFHVNTFNQVQSSEEWRRALVATLASPGGAPGHDYGTAAHA